MLAGFLGGAAAGRGPPLVDIVAPITRPVRILAVIALVAIAVRGMLAIRGGTASGRSERLPPSPFGTYLRLLALTLLNPATVVYFAALILGLPDLGDQPTERVAFVAGVLLSSMSWQLLLAAVGALA